MRMIETERAKSIRKECTRRKKKETREKEKEKEEQAKRKTNACFALRFLFCSDGIGWVGCCCSVCITKDEPAYVYIQN